MTFKPFQLFPLFIFIGLSLNKVNAIGTDSKKYCDCDSSNAQRTINLPSSVASPRSIGQYDAVRKGDFLYISRQIGEDLLTRKLIKTHSVAEECQKALNNTLLILRHAGCEYKNVVLFSWEAAKIEHLTLIDEVQGSLGMNSGTPDTVYAAGRGYGVGYILQQNSSFGFDYVAYACNWSESAQWSHSGFNQTCSCQQPYHHHAWNLPATVSVPVPPNKCFKRVSRGGNNVYITGTVGQSFLTGAVISGGLEAQLNKSLDNIALQLAQAGCTFENVIQVETLLKDLSLVPIVNKLYGHYFGERKSAMGHFINSERLVAGMKLGAEIQHIVDAENCAFTQPEYSVTPT